MLVTYKKYNYYEEYLGLATHVRLLDIRAGKRQLYIYANRNQQNYILKKAGPAQTFSNLRNLEEVCLLHYAQKLTKDT